MVARIDIKSCWRNRNGQRNGETLQNSTSVQRLTPTRIQTGRYEKTGLETHAKRLNRDSVVLGVGKPSNAQRGGRSGKRASSPIVRTGRAQSCEASNLT